MVHMSGELKPTTGSLGLVTGYQLEIHFWFNITQCTYLINYTFQYKQIQYKVILQLNI